MLLRAPKCLFVVREILDVTTKTASFVLSSTILVAIAQGVGRVATVLAVLFTAFLDGAHE